MTASDETGYLAPLRNAIANRETPAERLLRYTAKAGPGICPGFSIRAIFVTGRRPGKGRNRRDYGVTGPACRVLLLIVGVNFIGVGALIPVLPYTVIETLGLPASVMTMLLASFALAMFIANPILGRLSDHYGGRLVLFVSLAVSAAAHLWFALSSDILSMFAARIIAGFASGNTGVIQAMIADRTSAKAGSVYGASGAAIGVGFVAGPALGGFSAMLAAGLSIRRPFFSLPPFRCWRW